MHTSGKGGLSDNEAPMWHETDTNTSSRRRDGLCAGNHQSAAEEMKGRLSTSSSMVSRAPMLVQLRALGESDSTLR